MKAEKERRPKPTPRSRISQSDCDRRRRPLGRVQLWQLTGSSPDAADLGALKAQAVHQPLRVKNKGNDGAGVGVDGAAGSDRDQYDRTIDAKLPTISVPETGEGFFGHEHDDH
jgi:hypothetical protein